MQFENTLTINAPADEVFAYLAQPENLPRWNYALDTTEQTSAGPIGVGTTYRQTRTLPRPAEEHFRITEFDTPNLLTAEGDFGPFTGTTTYRLTPLDQCTTRLVNAVHLTATGALKAVAAIAGPPIKHAVAKNLDVLKHLLETPTERPDLAATGQQ
jgi:uncharacterized protein YndB with AHSA1/START domain